MAERPLAFLSPRVGLCSLTFGEDMRTTEDDNG